MKRIYCDGIFDLFHSGHLKHLKQIREHFIEPIFLLVGVISDKQSTEYKRKPIVDENRRLNTIISCIYVDDGFITNKLIMTEEFIKIHNIDYVIHALTDNDREQQRTFFEIPIKLGKFIELDYNKGISTTELINKRVTKLNLAVRREDTYNLLQARLNMDNTSTIGEFGYEDALLSTIISNYYCIDIINNRIDVDHINLFINSNEKMFKHHFFDYIIVNNFELYSDSDQLLKEFDRICKKGIYLSNICNIIEPEYFIQKGFNIVNNNTLRNQGYDVFKLLIN